MRERSEGVEGRCVAFTAASGSGGKQEVARARAGVRDSELLLLAGGGRRQEPGRWAGLATWAAGKAQVRFSLSLLFLFSICLPLF